MRPSVIKSKFARNEPAFATTLHLTDPSLFELTSLLGFDGIWIDMEHHAYSMQTAAELIRAARVGGADIIARPANGEFGRLSRMLEIGAHGIMYPRCESAAEAKQVVDAAKFAPIGKRGYDGSNPDAEFCLTPMAEYVRRANDNTFVLIQIEEPEAVERAEEIAAVEGVDAIMLGPGDLSVLSGIPGQFDHPTILKAFEKIAQAAKNTGKHWASVTFSLDHARRLRDMGAMLLFHSADIILVKEGLQRIQREFATLGFKPRSGR